MGKNVIASLLITASFAGHVAAQVHQHGEGEIMVAQDDNQWMVSIKLPKADAVGFEHEPENQAQQEAINQLAQRLLQNDQIVMLGNQCDLTEVTHSLDVVEDDHDHDKHQHDEHDHDKHEHDHHDHDSHAHEGHDHSDKETHSDVEADLLFTCQSEVNSITVALFSWATSLEKVNVQWVTKKGQGARDASPEQATIQF